MIVRKCEEKDIEVLANMFVEAFTGEPWNENWSYEIAYKRLEMVFDTPRFIGLVVEEKQQVLGALMGNLEYWHEGDHFNIKEFFLAPAAQGKGVGSLVLSQLKEHLKDYDVVVEELLTLNNRKIIGFYEKQGYKLNNEIVSMTR